MPFEFNEKQILKNFKNIRNFLDEIEKIIGEYTLAYKRNKEKEKIVEIRNKIKEAISGLKELEQIITIETNVLNYYIKDEEKKS